MFISVIIPTLNEEDHIGPLLEFLQNHPNKDRFEVIVVDGGSEDQTVNIVNDFDAKLISTKSASRARQMNKGAAHATGDILYFVHADVKLLHSFVEDIIGAVYEGAKCGCYRFKFESPHNPLLHLNGFFTRFPFKWCRGGDQTLFITREVFNKLNGFNEQFLIMEDYDLLDRLEENSIRFKVLPKSVKVSARKYIKNSYLKVQLANLRAMRMYRKGTSPQIIKEFYSRALN